MLLVELKLVCGHLVFYVCLHEKLLKTEKQSTLYKRYVLNIAVLLAAASVYNSSTLVIY